MDLDNLRSNLTQQANGWTNKYGSILWGLIYVGDCIRSLKEEPTKETNE